MHTDPAVELTTGEALGWNFPIHFHHGLKYPAAVVNDHGDGHAILLNFGVYYAPMEDLLPGLLAAGGVEPAVRVRAASGESADRAVARLLDEQEQTPATAPGKEATAPSGPEVTRWRDRDVRLIALLDDVDRDVTVSTGARASCTTFEPEAPGESGIPRRAAQSARQLLRAAAGGGRRTRAGIGGARVRMRPSEL